jgi:hypothetical protein
VRAWLNPTDRWSFVDYLLEGEDAAQTTRLVVPPGVAVRLPRATRWAKEGAGMRPIPEGGK